MANANSCHQTNNWHLGLSNYNVSPVKTDRFLLNSLTHIIFFFAFSLISRKYQLYYLKYDLITKQLYFPVVRPIIIPYREWNIINTVRKSNLNYGEKWWSNRNICVFSIHASSIYKVCSNIKTKMWIKFDNEMDLMKLVFLDLHQRNLLRPIQSDFIRNGFFDIWNIFLFYEFSFLY